MNEVITEIKRMNAESRKWMAEAEGRWAGMLTEDPAHWEGYGIKTVEDLHDYFDACFQREVEKGNVYGEEEFDAEPSEDVLAKYTAPLSGFTLAETLA